MPNKRFILLFSFLFFVLFLSTCSPAAQPTPTPTTVDRPTQTSKPPTAAVTNTAAPTHTATATSTHTPTVTPTPTPTHIIKNTPIAGAGYLQTTGSYFDDGYYFLTIGLFHPTTKTEIQTDLFQGTIGDFETADQRAINRTRDAIREAGFNPDTVLAALDARVIPTRIYVFKHPFENKLLLTARTDVYNDTLTFLYYLSEETAKPKQILSFYGSQQEQDDAFNQGLSVFRYSAVDEPRGKQSRFILNWQNGSITPLAPDLPGESFHLRFSADGKMITFQNTERTEIEENEKTQVTVTNRIYYTQADGSQPTMVAGDNCITPSWHPNNETIVTVCRENTNQTIVRVSLDGETNTLYTAAPGTSLWAPQFSPDGNFIVSVKKVVLSGGYLVLDLETGQNTSVVENLNLTGFVYGEKLSWSPDENWFLANPLVRSEHGGGIYAYYLCQFGPPTCQPVGSMPETSTAVWPNQIPLYEIRFDREETVTTWGPQNGMKWPSFSKNALFVTTSGEDAVLVSPPNLSIDAVVFPTVEIEMAVSAGTQAAFRYAIYPKEIPEADQELIFPIQADGEYHTYHLNLRDIKSWQGIVHRIHLNLSDQPAEVKIRVIRFLPQE